MFYYLKNFVINKCNNSVIFNIVRRGFGKSAKPTQLGRWGLIYDSKVNSRIDWSNEDHCGPCGSLKLDKYVEKNVEKNK
jgi:hypothetical protein